MNSFETIKNYLESQGYSPSDAVKGAADVLNKIGITCHSDVGTVPMNAAVLCLPPSDERFEIFFPA